MPASEARGIPAHDGDVVAVAADEDMRRARLAQPSDQADLVVHLRAERIDEDRLQRRLLCRCADQSRPDPGRRPCRRRRWRKLVLPELRSGSRRRLAFPHRRVGQAEDGKPRLGAVVGQAVGRTPGVMTEMPASVRIGQGGLDRIRRRESRRRRRPWLPPVAAAAAPPSAVQPSSTTSSAASPRCRGRAGHDLAAEPLGGSGERRDDADADRLRSAPARRASPASRRRCGCAESHAHSTLPVPTRRARHVLVNERKGCAAYATRNLAVPGSALPCCR